MNLFIIVNKRSSKFFNFNLKFFFILQIQQDKTIKYQPNQINIIYVYI